MEEKCFYGNGQILSGSEVPRKEKLFMRYKTKQVTGLISKY